MSDHGRRERYEKAQARTWRIQRRMEIKANLSGMGPVEKLYQQHKEITAACNYQEALTKLPTKELREYAKLILNDELMKRGAEQRQARLEHERASEDANEE